jgi:hypothetical protein
MWVKKMKIKKYYDRIQILFLFLWHVIILFSIFGIVQNLLGKKLYIKIFKIDLWIGLPSIVYTICLIICFFLGIIFIIIKIFNLFDKR